MTCIILFSLHERSGSGTENEKRDHLYHFCSRAVGAGEPPAGSARTSAILRLPFSLFRRLRRAAPPLIAVSVRNGAPLCSTAILNSIRHT